MIEHVLFQIINHSIGPGELLQLVKNQLSLGHVQLAVQYDGKRKQAC